jgi:hypothetical protein
VGESIPSKITKPLERSAGRERPRRALRFDP